MLSSLSYTIGTKDSSVSKLGHFKNIFVFFQAHQGCESRWE
jgi:hypothetical protein